MSADELEQFETDVLAGFVLARASAGLVDGTVRGDVNNLDQIRMWFGRPLWEMQPADADEYFGRVLHGAAIGTRLARSQALRIYFEFKRVQSGVDRFVSFFDGRRPPGALPQTSAARRGTAVFEGRVIGRGPRPARREQR